MKEVSERYASALFELARENDAVSDYKKEAKLIRELMDGELLSLLESHFVTKEEKKQLIKEIFENFDKYIVNFLCLLIDSSRIKTAREILECFMHKCNAELKIKEVYVTSARALNESDRNKICEAIKKKYDMEVELYEKIDPELLSGIKVMIDDRIIDASLKRRIDNMKKELLKESW